MPTVNLTQRAVDSAEPRSSRYTLFDSKLKAVKQASAERSRKETQFYWQARGCGPATSHIYRLQIAGNTERQMD
jgi:hypothetical protein